MVALASRLKFNGFNNLGDVSMPTGYRDPIDSVGRE